MKFDEFRNPLLGTKSRKPNRVFQNFAKIKSPCSRTQSSSNFTVFITFFLATFPKPILNRLSHMWWPVKNLAISFPAVFHCANIISLKNSPWESVNQRVIRNGLQMESHGTLHKFPRIYEQVRHHDCSQTSFLKYFSSGHSGLLESFLSDHNLASDGGSVQSYCLPNSPGSHKINVQCRFTDPRPWKNQDLT